MNKIVTNPEVRHDFMFLFDVTDGNANGDPDAGNLPRVDPETMQGIVTDVCLKRKIRNYVHLIKEDKSPFEIYVKNRGILAKQQEKAYKALDIKPDIKPNDDARKWMCEHFYDIRMFGAVMTMGKSGQKEGSKQLQWNCGQVRGPVQLTFARSVDMVVPMDISITRVALTNADDTERGNADDEQAASSQMGRKSIIPYGLYLGYGFFTPQFALDTGVGEEDLEILWNALVGMWDIDHSAARGLMGCKGLYIFSHDNSLGKAPAHKLFDCIQVNLKEGIVAPRRFSDYTVTVDEAKIPEGITLTKTED